MVKIAFSNVGNAATKRRVTALLELVVAVCLDGKAVSVHNVGQYFIHNIHDNISMCQIFYVVIIRLILYS